MLYTNPYKSASELETAVQRAGSQRKLSEELGVNKSVISRWGRDLGANLPNSGNEAMYISDDKINQAKEEDKNLLKTLKKMGDSASVEALADTLDCAPKKIREALHRLDISGYRINKSDPTKISVQRVPPGPSEEVHKELFEGTKIKFGVVSDTHIGSKTHNREALETAYDIMVDEGIRVVYHVGDFVDGYGIYRHQARSLYAHTFDEQVELCAEIYPKRDSIITKGIGGNHDLEGEFGKMAADPVRAICNQRDDIEYLGPYSAWIELPNGAYIHMLHPMGGAGYAISYRAQKLAEAYEAGKKPAMLFIGHWHRQGNFKHREIATFLVGAFQNANDYSVRIGGGPPNVGFHIIEATLADDGSLVRIKPEWLHFYPGRGYIL